MATTVTTDYPSLAGAVRERTGTAPPLCYQCMKCTSGCGIVAQADLARDEAAATDREVGRVVEAISAPNPNE